MAVNKSKLYITWQQWRQRWRQIWLSYRDGAVRTDRAPTERTRARSPFIPHWWHSIALIWGAIAFYTRIPIPLGWPMAFAGIARLAPGVGVLLGGLLASGNWLGQQVELPLLTRCAVLVVAWIGVTGGLHLDGVMDSADGLAVPDRDRRLAVMSDSRTGAFGVMAGGSVMLLKLVALYDLGEAIPLGLVLAAGWGRWGQLVAIARFPYLKTTGKGAFHKAHIASLGAAVPSLLGLVGVSLLWAGLVPELALEAIAGMFGGFAIAILVGWWFHHQFGGHTGDTYGAVVEWTEALLLVGLTMF